MGFVEPLSLLSSRRGVSCCAREEGLGRVFEIEGRKGNGGDGPLPTGMGNLDSRAKNFKSDERSREGEQQQHNVKLLFKEFRSSGKLRYPKDATKLLGPGRCGSAFMKALLKEMKEDGMLGKVLPLYNSMIHALGVEGYPNEMWSVFEEMQRGGIKPDIVTYNSLMKGFAKAGDLTKVRLVFKEVSRKGLTKTAVTNATMIDAFVRNGDVFNAEALLEKLKASEFELNAIAWASIMHAYSQMGDLERVEELLRDMQKQGHQPTSITYSIFMNALLKAGRTHRTVQVLQEDMARSGIPITADNYNVLLHQCAKRRDLKSALKLYSTMESNRVAPDLVTLNIMVNVAGKAGNVDVARSFLNESIHRGFKNNVVGYRTMLASYGRARKYEEEMRLLEEIQAEGIELDLKMMTSIIQTKIETGRLDEAIETFGTLDSLGIKADAFLANKILHALQRDGSESSIRKGVELCSQLETQRLPMNNHTNELAKLLRKLLSN
ncbi:hypothetical protein NDN08_002664 [Rhodosorus marinus]|uniref:Pentacotripeptide-repeat region of PRORP domain-containing protein n=1 Tax=Rhodosorus marinus TaxID=101924 RepID=A0AAV8UUI7_9RHOD|nr:hypothetical protein NDN08_002664 [Rhodosorus marinus]